MPSRAPARRLVVGFLVAVAALFGAVLWPLSADADNPNPAEVAESEKARELLEPAEPAPHRHGPSDKELGAFREKLDKKIRMDFTDASTLEVISKLLRESGIPFVIDNLTLLEGDGKVTLVAPAMSIRDALSQACDSFTHERGDWCIANGAIVVSSAKHVAVRTTTTRHYDIRHLLVQTPYFTSPPSLDLDQSLSNTSSGGSSYAGGGATTLFEDDDSGGNYATREEIIEQIITMIQDTVGSQAEWAAYGGELSSLRELNGRLTIRTSSRNHEQVTELLDGLGKAMHEMIFIEARAYMVKAGVLEQLRAENDGEMILNAKDAESFIQKLGEDKSARKMATGRYMMRNGQRAYIASTFDRTFLSDVEPVSGTGGADPTLSTARNGMVIDIEASATPRAGVIMTLRAEVSTGGAVGSTTIPIGPGYPSPDGDKKKKDEKMPGPAADFGGAPCGDDPEESDPAPPKAVRPVPRPGIAPAPGRATTPKPANPANPANPAKPALPQVAPPITPPHRIGPIADSATLATPSHDIFRVNTSLTIPANGAAIFSGSSKEQSSIGEEMELVVIIRAKASGEGKRNLVNSK